MMPLQIGTLCPNTSGMFADSPLTSFRSVIALWATREAMAADVGVSNWSVIKWFKRDAIPSEWWTRVCATETAKSAGVDADLLARLAAKQVEEARA
ncbi:hypothetical protein [Bradyrhizobium sp. 144]|uniref:hypothetical protein n=1 Tax=Bradyrhizobium sp. 144 TaxID=2782620 RepID=UPI001FFB6F96|nr:hypothetical protein [Bradyrhizobium sp. 144]MCK1693681.1 hypothetical protein [Bradyrhizobium sp. 144]